MIVGIPIGSAEATHAFSISNSPTEEGYLELTTRLRASDYKDALRKMSPGDSAQIDAPLGTFTLGDNVEAAGMLAGGIGITPFRSIMKYCTDTRTKTRITLIYGVRSEDDIIFKEDFEQMQKQNVNLKVVYVLKTAPVGFKGYTDFIDTHIIEKEIPDYKNTMFYVCGPPAMVKAMQNLLATAGVNAARIRLEEFGGYKTGATIERKLAASN